MNHGTLSLDAEALYAELCKGVRTLLTPETRLVGVTSGGAWLAERLQQDLGLKQPFVVISSAMHRDDFARRGMTSSAQTQIPFDVNGAHVLLLDDVLFTGRTVRARSAYSASAPSANVLMEDSLKTVPE